MNQSKLVMGYNMNDLTPYEAEYALQIYLYILGLGPDSKLFTNVREKESLCYTIASTAKYAGSFMMISAGIDASTFDKTVEYEKDCYLIFLHPSESHLFQCGGTGTGHQNR